MLKPKKNKFMFHILVDMDEVTCDLHSEWVKWINENGDPDLKAEDVKSWNFDQYTSIGKKCYEFLAIPGVFLDLKPKQNALQVIERLRKMGHTIQFCTSPPINSPTAKEEKTEWLKHHFKWFNPETDVIFSHDKSDEEGDILFDDRAKWCYEFPGVGVCMDAPHNQGYEGFRVTNWLEFESLIKHFTKYLDLENM
jgi:5'(3')-deoxyribonucleotidase